MAGSRVLAVAGTHGKTTTTGLLTSALLAAGADPSYAVGGVLTATGRNADAGTDDLFVAEADESDGAFLVYRPHAAIVTNVEADHLDNWGTEEAYHRAFEEFADTDRPLAASSSACSTTPAPPSSPARHARRASRSSRWGSRPTPTCASTTSPSTAPPPPAGSRAPATDLGELRLRIPGRHYVLDAVAALAMGLRLGCSFDALVEGLGRLHRHRPPDGAEGRGRRHPRLRLLRPPPRRDPRRPRGRPRAGRRGPGGRGVPAPPRLAHPHLRRGDGRRPRRGRRGRRARRLRRPRGPGPRGDRPPRRRRRAAAAPSTSPTSTGWPPRRRCSPSARARATSSSPSAPATSRASGRRCSTCSGGA